MDEKQIQTTFNQIQQEKATRYKQMWQFVQEGTEPKADCKVCSKPVDFNTFIEPVDLKEWLISGMCKECQDKIFE